MKKIVFIFYLSVAHTTLGRLYYDFPAKQTFSLTDITRNKKENSDGNEVARQSDYKRNYENSIETGQLSNTDFKGQKRSVIPYLGHDYRLISDLKFGNLSKQTLLDKDSDSMVNEDENNVNSHEHEHLYIEEGPAIKGGWMAGVNVPFENMEIKSVITDHGHDFRHMKIGAGIWDRKRLIGLMAKRKKKNLPYFHDTSKTDDNKNSDTDDKLHKSRNMSEMSVRKRYIYGMKGPIKRPFHSAILRIKTPRILGLFMKRISSDFGYGSREQDAANLALDSIKGKAFGIFGPGKRLGLKRSLDSKDAMDVDSGYGSRIQAASQIANDVVTINDVYGLFGPGRR